MWYARGCDRLLPAYVTVSRARVLSSAVPAVAPLPSDDPSIAPLDEYARPPRYFLRSNHPPPEHTRRPTLATISASVLSTRPTHPPTSDAHSPLRIRAAFASATCERAPEKRERRGRSTSQRRPRSLARRPLPSITYSSHLHPATIPPSSYIIARSTIRSAANGISLRDTWV